MGLITENNAHYYSGQQVEVFSASTTNPLIKWTGDTELKPSIPGAQNSNYQVFLNNVLLVEFTEYNLVGSEVEYLGTVAPNDAITIQLIESARQENYGSYSYIKLDDIINNFIVAYVGVGKLIQSCKRTDLIFHAKRAMQEFSYDTLKSIKSQELTIPHNLSIVIPQDYVNYVGMSWYDSNGIGHKIYPTTLTTNPFKNPVQDKQGIPMQDSFGDNIQGTSMVEDRWKNNFNQDINLNNIDAINNGVSVGYGSAYGLNPQYANSNGWFTINEREGKFSFSSNLVDRLIVLEYISDGLAYDLDTKVPKLAEDAMYAYMSHAVISGRANQPEYIVNRLKREKSAKLRNAKIRLSNIKPSEIVQVMRGKSKWIKH
jgi:hypothetical protein